MKIVFRELLSRVVKTFGIKLTTFRIVNYNHIKVSTRRRHAAVVPNFRNKRELAIGCHI